MKNFACTFYILGIVIFCLQISVFPQTEMGKDNNKSTIQSTIIAIEKQKKAREIALPIFANMEEIRFDPTSEWDGPKYFSKKLIESVKYDIYKYFDPSEVNTPLKKAKLVGTEEYKRIQDKLEKEKDVALSKWYFFVAKPMDHYYDLDTKRYIINDYKLSSDDNKNIQINNIIFKGLQHFYIKLNGKNNERLKKFDRYAEYPKDEYLLAISVDENIASTLEDIKELYIGFKFKFDGTFSNFRSYSGGVNPRDDSKPNANSLYLLILKRNSDLVNDFTVLKEISVNN